MNGTLETVQDTDSRWTSSPDDKLVKVLSSRYAEISSLPVAKQIQEIASIVVPAQETVNEHKRGAPLIAGAVYYGLIYAMIFVTAAFKFLKGSAALAFNAPLHDLSHDPTVIVLPVDGKKLTGTASSTASIPSVTSSLSIVPCEGKSCRASGDPVSGPGPTYECNLPGKSGHPCARMVSDLFNFMPSDTAFGKDAMAFASSLAVIDFAGMLHSISIPAQTTSEARLCKYANTLSNKSTRPGLIKHAIG